MKLTNRTGRNNINAQDIGEFLRVTTNESLSSGDLRSQ